MEDQLSEMDAALCGVAADSARQLARFRDRYGLPCTMLSDPELVTAGALGVRTMSKHPMSLTYPRKAFLQPAMFVWLRDGTLVHQWIQTPKITNLYGASNRPSPEQLVQLIRQCVS